MRKREGRERGRKTEREAKKGRAERKETMKDIYVAAKHLGFFFSPKI